jgi:hypothetical protein
LFFAKYEDKFAERVVLPVPPFPLAMVIFICKSPFHWSKAPVKIPLTLGSPQNFKILWGKTYATPLARETIIVFIFIYVFEI